MPNFIHPQQLSVVVPVRNEQENVESLIAEINAASVSYTHLDVYKRQNPNRSMSFKKSWRISKGWSGMPLWSLKISDRH